MSTADYQRQWRASKGARTGKPGPAPTAPCGTVSAYKRHKRNGEPIDDACRQAWNAEHRRLYAKRKSAS